MEDDLSVSPDAKRTYLILHGFYESAPIIKKNLGHLLPKDANILIPNGCFPLPKRRPGGWEMFFSWYFFDEKTQEFYVEYEFPASVLEELVNSLGLADLPITIIGYSQGGYLSPFVAERLPTCDHVIALGCSYRHELLSSAHHYRVDGIHGDADDKVDPINAEKCFSGLDPKIKGQFIKLEGVGHDIEENFFNEISKLLK